MKVFKQSKKYNHKRYYDYQGDKTESCNSMPIRGDSPNNILLVVLEDGDKIHRYRQGCGRMTRFMLDNLRY